MKRLLVTLLAGSCQAVNADWISLCGADQGVANTEFRVLRTLRSGDGTMQSLIATPGAPVGPGCSSSEVPFKSSQILWSAFLNESAWTAVNEARQLFFIGKQEAQKFTGEIAWPERPDHPAGVPLTWPAYIELGGHLEITPFGNEERASIRREQDGLRVTCDQGTQAAGVLIRLGSETLPKLIGLSLSMTYRGTGRWRMGRVDSRSSDQDPVHLADLDADTDWQTSRLGMDRHITESTRSLTLLCPTQAASIEFGHMELQAPTLAQTPARSTWIWEPQDWQNRTERLWTRLNRLDIKRLFITVLLDDSGTKLRDPDTLRQFIREAASHQIEVWAVEGNPVAVLPEEHEKWIARATAFQDYNASVGIGEQLRGMQFDIEPYLNEGYQLNPDQWKTAYIRLLHGLHEVLEMPVDVAIPVWWAQETLDGKPFLDAFTDVVDGLTVMDYKTDPWRILHMANPILSWGVTHRKHVNIALESVNLGTETRWTFTRSAGGDLSALHLGQAIVFIRSDHPVEGGSNPLFALDNVAETHLETTTFYGKPDTLENLLKPLENSFRVWASFQGLALHEVLKNRKDQ